MKKKDLKKLKGDDLNKKMTELNSELIILKGQSKTGTPPKNPGQIRAIRRTMAKIHTMRNKKTEEK
jgi:large subunit ribosomal protein L29